MTEQLSLFDIDAVPAVGSWYKKPGEPIRFDEICRDYVNRVVLVELCGRRFFRAVRILRVLYYDHENPRNSDPLTGHWCRRIVYNDSGVNDSYCDEYDREKDQHFYSCDGAEKEDMR